MPVYPPTRGHFPQYTGPVSSMGSALTRPSSAAFSFGASDRHSAMRNGTLSKCQKQFPSQSNLRPQSSSGGTHPDQVQSYGRGSCTNTQPCRKDNTNGYRHPLSNDPRQRQAPISHLSTLGFVGLRFPAPEARALPELISSRQEQCLIK